MADEDSKIVIKGDEILQKHGIWSGGERDDASRSGERRQAIGAYCEEHGIENKAFSQVRAGLKIKNSGKRRDWLRTLQLLLPVAEREIFDNEPEMDLDDDNAPESVEVAEEDDIQSDADDFEDALDDASDNIKAFPG